MVSKKFDVAAIAERYGFQTKVLDEKTEVYAEDESGKTVLWFYYNEPDDTFYGSDTACLRTSRPDLTADDLLSMFSELGTQMRFFVSPEDWQGTTRVREAENDLRYTEMRKYTVTDPVSLRQLCIKNRWFSSGTFQQNKRLFFANSHGWPLDSIALIIWLCTEDVTIDEVRDALLEAAEDAERRKDEAD